MLRVGVAILALTFGGCASTMGVSFPSEHVDEIRIGETRSEQIRELFGSPWQVGIEDGLVAWTYVFYRQPVTGPMEARDLVVLFDDTGHVSSYRFHTTIGEEHDDVNHP
jgi:outer membrane protein assembly factor BamE (lipoprotein component of BamABCDE complex)